MRYSFLDLLACPVTHEPLVLVGAVEEPRAMPAPYLSPASRVSPPSTAVGPIPTTAGPRTQIFDVLSAHAAKPDAAARNEAVIVREGLLVACNSGRWYPIVDGLPELLPDSLRDWSRDRAIFASTMQRLPQAVSNV